MKLIKIDENTTIMCDVKDTRSGFKHEATLFINGNEIRKTKICYLNRTWERFQYESVLNKLKGISQELKDIELIEAI